MDDAADKALEALKFHIKKEIIDHYFSERVYLEEDIQFLHEELEVYHREAAQVSRLFLYLYQALGSEAAIGEVMELLGLKEWPCYGDFCQMSPAARQELLRGQPRRGFTSYGRFRNLVFDLYDELWHQNQALREKSDKILSHVRLLNEDIDKFNLSFDFGLIAAQIEALEGREAVISGGLLAPEREELSTRMRFKRQKLGPQDLPAPVQLPALQDIKARLAAILERAYSMTR
jgi:hypothetical protein